MEESRKKLETQKLNLIKIVVQEIFEEDIRSTIKNGDYSSIEDLDGIVEEKFCSYLELKKQIETFYENRIYE